MPSNRSHEDPIDDALARWTTPATDWSEKVERERIEVERLFPLKEWPSLQLERYAMGTGNRESYCRVMEFGTPHLGRIGGGSAAKHIIYQRLDGGWYTPSSMRDLPASEVWSELRSQFVQSFDAARKGDLDAIDELALLRHGQTLVLKSLATYFPGMFLPVYGEDHLRHFISLLGEAPLRNASRWRLNRQLIEAHQAHPLLASMQQWELVRFLYGAFDPRVSGFEALMISPGRGARLWPDCLASGQIRIGYEEIGDLTQYADLAELRAAVNRGYSRARSGITRITNELAAFRDLAPGTRVVANLGQSRVLAVGTVTEAGYRFDPGLSSYRHTVGVDWDESYAQELSPQLTGYVGTFYKVGTRLWNQIAMGRAPSPKPEVQVHVNPAPEITLSDRLRQLLALIDRKGAVILDGPPGTGKTRLAFDAALALVDRAAAIDGLVVQRAVAINEMLASSAGKPAQVVLTTFHPTYGYEDFIEGFKPVDTNAGGLTLRHRDGVFIQLCNAARADPARSYILIVDEINRADLPRVLGELITVMEKEKRGYPITLPLTGAVTTIPPNVLIIGTMNTSDRSVSHLDSAIRRRFGFMVVPPEPEVVAGTVGVLDLEQFLRQLNERICHQFGRAHQLGHGYLLRDDQPLASEEDLHSAFYHDIIPTLEDHALDDLDKLEAVLGELTDREGGGIKQVSAEDLPEALAAEFQAEIQSAIDG